MNARTELLAEGHQKIISKGLNLLVARASEMATGDGCHPPQRIEHSAGTGVPTSDRKQAAPAKAGTVSEAVLRQRQKRKPGCQTTGTAVGRLGSISGRPCGQHQTNSHVNPDRGVPTSTAALAGASGDRAGG